MVCFDLFSCTSPLWLINEMDVADSQNFFFQQFLSVPQSIRYIACHIWKCALVAKWLF